MLWRYGTSMQNKQHRQPPTLSNRLIVFSELKTTIHACSVLYDRYHLELQLAVFPAPHKNFLILQYSQVHLSSSDSIRSQSRSLGSHSRSLSPPWATTAKLVDRGMLLSG